MSFLSELTTIQRLGLGGIVILLLLLVVVRRRQAAAAAGSSSTEKAKADKPKKAEKAKKAKAEKPARTKRSRRGTDDGGGRSSKRRRRGGAGEDPVAPSESVAAPSAALPVVPVASLEQETPALVPADDAAEMPPGWPLPGEARADMFDPPFADDDTAVLPTEPVPGSDVFDPAAVGGEPDAAAMAWPTEQPLDPPMPGGDEVDPTGQTTEWAQPDPIWTPDDEPAIPSAQPEWAQPDDAEWVPADSEWTPSDDASARPAYPEWAQPEGEWSSDDGSDGNPSDGDWDETVAAGAADGGWAQPEAQEWSSFETFDTDAGGDMSEAPSDMYAPADDWSADDSEFTSVDQLVSEATGIGIDPAYDSGAAPEAFSPTPPEAEITETGWQPVDETDVTHSHPVEIPPVSAIPVDGVGGFDPDAVLAALSGEEPWPTAAAGTGAFTMNGHDTAPEPPVATGQDDSVDDGIEDLPTRRPALETLHHLSAGGGRIRSDEAGFNDAGGDEHVAAAPADPSEPATPTDQRQAEPVVNADVDDAPHPEPTATPGEQWITYAAPGTPAAAPAGDTATPVQPFVHASGPRQSWAGMTPAPVKPAETLSPVQRWARLRPSSGPAPRPAVPRAVAPSRPVPSPGSATTEGDRGLRRGRFALGGHALHPGQETVSGVTYRSEVVPPPTRWLLGPVTGPVSPGTLVLIIEGHVNCDATDLEVVMDPGFAPTVDGFSLRLRASQEGSFAASGTYEIH